MTAPMLREFAHRLFAFEANADDSVRDRLSPLSRVSEKLRLPLSALAGAAGFQSLMARALTLAREEVPWLDAARVDAEGVLALDADPQLDTDRAAHGGEVVIAQLLGLLVDFIGRELTLTLVHESWPAAGEFSKEEKN